MNHNQDTARRSPTAELAMLIQRESRVKVK